MHSSELPTARTQERSGAGHKLVLPGNTLPFVLVTALFFFWGIPNNLNDILIKQFMKSFEISRFEAGFLQSAFYMGYFLLSIPAALIMKKYGYKSGLVIGLFLYSAGTFLFWPAAIVQQYSFFLFALFVIASGLAFLETGANPFVAVLGDPKSSERRLNFSQAFNPLGAVVGVLIGTIFIFSGIELSPGEVTAMKAAGTYDAYLEHETMRVVTPYLVLGSVVFLWALLIIKTKFPRAADEMHDETETSKGRARDLLHHRHFVLGVIAQFFYVGAQVGTWSYFIQYVQDYTGQPEKVAGYFLTGTLVAFGVGRFTATYLMNFIQPNKLMGIYGIANVVLVTIGVLFPGWIGVWAIFLTSFFMSLMFPTIFALGIKRLGPNTKLGGSMIVMAIIGGAVFTPMVGLVFELTHSMALAMLVVLVCYVFITYYSFVGSKVRTAPRA
ncbi:MAG: L-fucose:H+ symporter permease [Bryobacteraceae bacterium]|nr:L-fucose:H+ symporter permease [Bryobacteraceae bacterium]